jgi:hypothetical protein
MSLSKLQEALPQLVGRTIERTLVSEHRDGRFQVFLFFTDGTAYEFYGRDSINGARRIDRISVSTICRCMPRDTQVLVAPDRRRTVRPG